MTFKIGKFQVNLMVTKHLYGDKEPTECTSEFLSYMAINWFQASEYCRSEGHTALFDSTRQQFRDICAAQEEAERMNIK